ncbi:hypothetical protein BDA99DRAFT_338995 [Phascolomyces articulosus]|uniref:F-box domain-containing protein n=1 Tax=Phascolomyces articulosus TaxID=60185 RepID=A0AAD5K4H3_9FUNG|nr:hypothetical protein BDA99DRAFT_338995 [Phascolomyces articulosus]
MMTSLSSIMTGKDGGGFVDFLPYDIVSAIFSYLDQGECLTCLDVCSAWYKRVPEYTRTVWQTLKINNRFQKTMINSYRARFLGEHVKHVQISSFSKRTDEEFFMAMKQLFDCGCNKIESLGIYMKRRNRGGRCCRYR